MVAFTSENLITILNNVTVAQRATAEKAVAKFGSVKGALSAYLKTGRKAGATIGAVADCYKGLLETFQHGQKSRLTGVLIPLKSGKA